jgi:glutamine synthetase
MHSTPESRRAGGKRDTIKQAREQNVRFVRLVFADIFGVSKNVSIPVDQLEHALDGRVTFDGGSIDGFVRGEELDMLLRPDPSTFAIYPWEVGDGREARLICDIAMPDGAPFEGCPRTTLRRAIESAPALAGARVGLEIEFFLFERGAGGLSTQTSDVGSYFDFSANDRGEEARNAIVAALREMGVPVASAHHEHGAGQHEIDVAHDDPLSAADHVLTLRTIAKHVAADFGLDATFMPKPLETRAGSGLHVDLRLPDAADEAMALYVVGGLLAHAAATTAVCNPTVNSYKRLVAAWDAPIYGVWSERSANALVRVPPGQTPPRVEMRSPDPACNPYLALAVLLGTANDGIARETLPGPALVGSTYELSDRDRRERGIGTLPKSLRQAIGELDADPVVRAALGDHLYHAFRDAKMEEYERYRRAVHPWEREQYLRLYKTSAPLAQIEELRADVYCGTRGP